MIRPQQHSAQNDLLRGYLLLWISLATLWGLIEVGNRVVVTAWAACSSGSGLPEICEQLKQHLDTQGRPDIAALPPAVLAALLWFSVTLFLLFLLLFALLLWLSLSERRSSPLLWCALAGQGVLACTLGLGVPALSVTVPVSLVLVLILEVCSLFLRVHTTLALSCGIIICFFLASVLAWSTGRAFHESSLDLSSTLLLLVIGFLFVGGFFLFYSRLARMHLALETAYRRLAAASAQVEALTLITERERMARELHDTLAQGLAGLILQLGVVHARVREHQDQETQVILEQILTSARETLAHARGAIDDLRVTPAFPQELVAAAQEEVQRFTHLSAIPCEADLELLSQVPPAHREQALGVIREGLANVARHARARRAWVCVSRDGQGLRLEIGDDGSGFDPAQASLQPGHYGLLGLRERAQLASGQLTILSAPGQGTRIQLCWPAAAGTQDVGEEGGGES